MDSAWKNDEKRLFTCIFLSPKVFGAVGCMGEPWAGQRDTWQPRIGRRTRPGPRSGAWCTVDRSGAMWRFSIGAVRHVAEQESQRIGPGPREQARGARGPGRRVVQRVCVPRGFFLVVRIGRVATGVWMVQWSRSTEEHGTTSGCVPGRGRRQWAQPARGLAGGVDRGSHAWARNASAPA